jgi:hypothetical protein
MYKGMEACFGRFLLIVPIAAKRLVWMVAMIDTLVKELLNEKATCTHHDMWVSCLLILFDVKPVSTRFLQVKAIFSENGFNVGRVNSSVLH